MGKGGHRHSPRCGLTHGTHIYLLSRVGECAVPHVHLLGGMRAAEVAADAEALVLSHEVTRRVVPSSTSLTEWCVVLHFHILDRIRMVVEALDVPLVATWCAVLQPSS